MKVCIWCRKTESIVSFNNKAHTIPKSLGGTHICKNICDNCNTFFGNPQNGYPSVEAILKDTFGISRAMLLNKTLEKYKHINRFTTSYFKVDLDKSTIKLKQSYSVNRGFQEKVCRQMKKGIYKIFLEEMERQNGNALDERFDFIREFARHDLGDCPVINFERRYGLIFVYEPYILKPELYFDQNHSMKYLICHPHFYEFEFLGHVLSIATTRHWIIDFDNYIKESVTQKAELFKRWQLIQKFNDIDLALSIFNNKVQE